MAMILTKREPSWRSQYWSMMVFVNCEKRCFADDFYEKQSSIKCGNSVPSRARFL